MLLVLWFLIVFGGGLFWLLQPSLRVLKRHGMSLSNQQIAALANAGDPDALRLKRRQRRYLVAAVIASLMLVGAPLVTRHRFEEALAFQAAFASVWA